LKWSAAGERAMIYIQVSELLEKNDAAPAELQDLLVWTAEQTLAEVIARDRDCFVPRNDSEPIPPDADAALLLTDDAQLCELNRSYLGVDAPTDVLAFPGGEIDPETNRYYLGDIIVSVERAAEQALAGGHPLTAELQLLLVHGMLHLCGYDHADPQGKAEMWERQAEILRRLDCPIHGPLPEIET